MPVGILRLNAKKSQPNLRITFIKPLKGPGEKAAQEFLERIAAQCVPIMRDHHLSVMSLEEHEPNREFVGRNFNAGEVIQLVLRSGRTGRWLPFRYVQMVMMHELAHCLQMNHSAAFWAVRNLYAAEMRALWAREYTGDGIWGRGAAVGTGAWERDVARLGEEPMPDHLCGGTFRSRRKAGAKRKAKRGAAEASCPAEPSYRERKERRILKKFGPGGMPLGADEAVKAGLVKGGKSAGVRPRVAGSMRGRELRAAAALARFGGQANEGDETKREDVETESDYEEADMGLADAVGVDGKPLLDSRGQGMVKVCGDVGDGDGDDGDGDGDGDGSRNELRELEADIKQEQEGEGPEEPLPWPRIKPEFQEEQEADQEVEAVERQGRAELPLPRSPRVKSEFKEEEEEQEGSTPTRRGWAESPSPSPPPPPCLKSEFPEEQKGGTLAPAGWAELPQPLPLPLSSPSAYIKSEFEEDHVEAKDHVEDKHEVEVEDGVEDEDAGMVPVQSAPAATPRRPPPLPLPAPAPPDRLPSPPRVVAGGTSCRICSLVNAPLAVTCEACSNVLDPDAVPGSWRCLALACRKSGYINAGDCGVCGVCGRKRGGIGVSRSRGR